MKKNSLMIGIVVLFVVSAFSPVINGNNIKITNKQITQSTSSSNGMMDSSWPMYQHDAANTGFSSSSFPDSLNLLYNNTYEEILHSAFASFQSAPILADGKIFIAGWGAEADIIALHENNGSLIWKKRLPLYDSSTTFGFVNSPVVSNGKVFVCFGSMMVDFPPQSKIFALDENTGEIVWENHFFTSSGYPSLTISDDKVIVGGHFTNVIPISRLYVFNVDNGDLIWSKTMLGFFESTPAVANNIVFATTSCISPMTIGFNAPLFSGRARVYAFDLNDGSKIWNARIKGHVIVSSPTVSNGKLLVPSTIHIGRFITNRRITSLDVETGNEIWHYEKKRNGFYSCWPASISAPSVAYGIIFLNDATGLIIALDENTGEKLWENEIIDDVASPSMCSTVPPVIADYKVITASYERDNYVEKSEICMFNVTNGDKIWITEFDVSEHGIHTPFVLANGKLLINSGENIYVYG